MRKLIVSFVIAALCLACKDNSSRKPGSHPKAEAPTAPTTQTVPEKRIEAVVQEGPHAAPRAPASAKGVFEPAPYLKEATCVAAWSRDGTVTIAAGGVGWLKLFRNGTEVAKSEVKGACQHLEVLGENDEHLVALYGTGRGAADAKANALLFSTAEGTLERPHRLELPKTSRHQLIGAADAGKGAIYVGAFESKYFVEIWKHTPRDGEWKATKIAKIRMPWRMASGDFDGDGALDLVVARPYGDTRDALGDALLVSESGELTRIPTTMGARSITVSGADRALVIADGWHQNYGQKARALITKVTIRKTKDFEHVRLAEIEGRTGFSGLQVADLDGDGKREVLASGDGSLVIVPIDGGASSSIEEAGSCTDAAVIDLDGKAGDEIIVVGERPGIWSEQT